MRLFNVFGPRARSTGQYGAVFGVFLAQKLAKKPLTIVGDGTQTRDFIYVDDVVSAFLRAADAQVKNTTINIGAGKTYSINDLVKMLDHDFTSIPKRPGEPDCTWANISRAKKLLHWKPLVPFKDGVNRMLKDIGSWTDAPVWTPASIEQATRAWFNNLGQTQ